MNATNYGRRISDLLRAVAFMMPLKRHRTSLGRILLGKITFGTPTARSLLVFVLAVWLTPFRSASANNNENPKETPLAWSPIERDRILKLSPLGPIPPDPTNAVADDPRAAHFGQFLFYEKRLSSNQQIACSTCHEPQKAFTDARSIAQGLGKGERHTASLWNVAYNRWYFWDGRGDSLWAQSLRPLESPLELGSSRLALAHLVYTDKDLRAAYEVIFGSLPNLSDGTRFPSEGRPVIDDVKHAHHGAWNSMSAADQESINRVFVNLGKSLAAFERRIVSRASLFDQFVEGLRSNDHSAISRYPVSAQKGLRIFLDAGNCRLCHSGPNFTDGEFHDTRLATSDGGPPRDPGRYAGAEQALRDPFNALGAYSDEREGPAADKLNFLANSPRNWGLFKTPTLRNVAVTPPYMHHGQLATLRDVVNHYSNLPNAADSHHPEKILVRLNLSDKEIDDLVAFLATLTDVSLDPSLLRQPLSPQFRSPK